MLNDAARSAGQRVLEIELGLERHVGLWETGAMPYLFEAGRRAARAQLAQIRVLLRDVLPPTPDLDSLAA
ncbi:MAG: hypothetical protein K8R60_09385 [Burkholderiales bacterium]|nr:hypothetical protein [Burkholderiales bacterium]